MEEAFDAELESLRPVTPLQLRLIPKLQGFKYKIEGVRRWRGVVHSIIIWLRLYHYHSSQVREILRYFSDSDLLADAIDDDSVDELLFSPHWFRRNKQLRVNPHTLNIMRQDPEERPASQVRPIESGLRGYAAFHQYPAHLLRKIAEKAWYQEFDKFSVIIREGDYPLYYYFIVYGSALVTIVDKGAMTARTVTVLNRGDSFGELAIINCEKRASTVIARERCGLMMLEDKHYLDIFMQGGVKFLNERFVTSHPMFDGFDLGILKANPRAVKLNFFNPGITIVEDSRLFFWILLVISGKATVKMAVRKSTLEKHREAAAAGKPLKAEQLDLLHQQQQKQLEEQQQLIAEYQSGRIGHRTVIRRNWRRHVARQEKLFSDGAKVDVDLEIRQLQLPIRDSPTSELSIVGREDTVLVRNRSVSLLSKAHFKAPVHDEADEKQAAASPPTKAEAPKQQQQQQQKAQQAGKVTYVTGKQTVLGRRTLATDLNREFFEQLQAKIWSGEFLEQSDMEYLPVQQLSRGMVFGLADKFFENQPPLKLVSEGCELLCIRREIYLDSVGEITLFNLANSMRPYPTENEVLTKNNEVNGWFKEKRRSYNSTVAQLATEKVDINDARTRFPNIDV